MDDTISQERIAIVELADDLQVRKQRIFKILRRLGIRPEQQREPTRRNQNVATVSQTEAAAIRTELGRSASPSGSEDGTQLGRMAVAASDDVGFFYIIELEPAHDPGRFKVGFTTDLEGRLRKHRCSAPFAQCSHHWPCRRGWERTAVDCVTQGCEQLHTEVFRAPSLERIAAQAASFFAMMPNLDIEAGEEGNGTDMETLKETG